MLVVHACDPSYLGGWDWEDHSLRPAWENSSRDSISKISRAKWTGGVAQMVECLLCQWETLSTNSSPAKKKRLPHYNLCSPSLSEYLGLPQDYLLCFYQDPRILQYICLCGRPSSSPGSFTGAWPDVLLWGHKCDSIWLCVDQPHSRPRAPQNGSRAVFLLSLSNWSLAGLGLLLMESKWVKNQEIRTWTASTTQ
jgi:hypothetical protein